jgi:protein-disulfide isomerase
MNRTTELLGPDDHVLGRPNAPVNLIEYGDYECPFCARAKVQIDEALRRVGDHVCFAYRHFPLTVPHPHALLAAQAAEAASAQDRFWPMHTLLYEHRDALGLDRLLTYAAALGLDVERFATELRGRTHLKRVQKDVQSGLRSGVHGTPTFFVNGRLHEGGWSADALAQALAAALRRQRVFVSARRG